MAGTVVKGARVGTVLPISDDVPRVVLDGVTTLALVVPTPILLAREVVARKEVVVVARGVVLAKEAILVARGVDLTKEVVLLLTRVARVVKVVRGLLLSLRMVRMVRVVDPARVDIFCMLVTNCVVLDKTLVLKRVVDDRTLGPIGVGGRASIP